MNGKKLNQLVWLLILMLCLTGCGESENGVAGKYAVSFYSNNGTVLKVDYVDKHGCATPPAIPQMEYGTVFRSWDTDFSDVTGDLSVHPVCEEYRGKTNAFAIAGGYGKSGDTVTVPVTLCGDVCVAGFDATIIYDPEMLELLAVNEDGAVICNTETPGQLRINYVSVENTQADVDVCLLEFRVKAESGSAPVGMTVHSIYACKDTVASEDDSLYVQEATVLAGEVFIIP